MSNIPDHENPENDSPDEDDGSFSTSDFFKRWQDINDEQEEEAELIESIFEEDEDLSEAELEDICDRVTRLIHDRRKRNDKDEWDDIFGRLRRADLWGSAQFDKRVHRDLLRVFGYDPMAGQLDKRLRKMENSPIRSKVMRHIFRSLNWRGDKSDRLLAQQRLWLLVSSGAIPEPHKRKPKKRRRKKGNNNSGCFWFILFVILIFVFFA